MSLGRDPHDAAIQRTDDEQIERVLFLLAREALLVISMERTIYYNFGAELD